MAWKMSQTLMSSAIMLMMLGFVSCSPDAQQSSGTPTLYFSKPTVETWLATHPSTLVAFLTSNDTAEFRVYAEAATTLSKSVSVGYVLEEALLPPCASGGATAARKPCTVILQRHGMPVTPTLERMPSSPKELVAWAMEKLNPPVIPFTREFMKEFQVAWNTIADKILIMLPGDDEKWWEAAVAAAHAFPKLKFVMGLPGPDGEQLLDMVGVKAEELPALMAIEHWSQAKYLERKADVQEMQPFIKRYQADLIPRHIKSEPEPAADDGPIQVWVGTTIVDTVLSPNTSAFLFIHAKFCQHSKAVSPAFEEAAQALKDLPNLVIGRFDGTANELPSALIEYKGFPTIYYVSRSNLVSQLTGERTAHAMVGFVHRLYQSEGGTIPGRHDEL
ncbi:hypothetical protein ACKKBG_A01475 [Auxenochlorella protothecoides x Auxenochlorella symbiontica]